MKYKKIMLILITAIFLVSIAGVCAADANDTLVASENTNQIELSDSDKVIEDNLQTSEENDELTLTDNDVLGADSATYSDLDSEIRASGNVTLTHKNYIYDEGATAITITEDNKVIDGNGAVIDMTGSTIRAFTVYASGVTIKNLTIKNANYNDDGGTIFFAQSGSVTNCNFTGNKATGDDGCGGAVFFLDEGTVSNCNFVDNTANYEGGAIRFSGSGTVTNCNFADNEAYQGGAVYFSNNGEVRNCNFAGNNATGDGGAINMGSGSVSNCNFADNSANEGGAIYSLNWYTAADTCIFKSKSDTININVIIVSPILNVDNFTTFYGSGEKLTFNLTTNSGMPVNNGNISISVYFKDNNSWVRNYSCLSGEGWTVSLPVGSYYAIFDTEYAEFKPINRTITVNKAKTELLANPITATYNTNKELIITLKDKNGKPLNGLPLTVKITGIKTYTTDKNGQIKISVGKLRPKTYNIKITFGENENYLASSANVKVTVKKAKSKITAKKKTFKATKKIKKYTVVLKSGKTPIKKAKLTLKIKGKTYKVKTNKKGKATFKIKKLKKGTQKAVITYKGNANYKKATKKVKIKCR